MNSKKEEAEAVAKLRLLCILPPFAKVKRYGHNSIKEGFCAHQILGELRKMDPWAQEVCSVLVSKETPRARFEGITHMITFAVELRRLWRLPPWF